MKEGEWSTSHQVISGDSRKLTTLENESIDLVVTSPPYPMIEMWDEAFISMNQEITADLIINDPLGAFSLMHKELDKVWAETVRVLKPGSMACINIGDATRTIARGFQLFTNHARIIQSMQECGASTLPNIIWKKPTNAPNKFMGSGMLPVGAYVTLEHEYILIFRKGNKKQFEAEAEKKARQQSAYFWEERNTWFSDTWELKGATQRMFDQKRDRSAAYPIEIPHRLINMFSLIGDTILDPFNGTGTTTKAAIANGRNSIGFEVDSSLVGTLRTGLVQTDISNFNQLNENRLTAHKNYVQHKGNEYFKHTNSYYNFSVKTRQETELRLPLVDSICPGEQDALVVKYRK